MDIKGLIQQYKQIRPDNDWSLANRSKISSIYQLEDTESITRFLTPVYVTIGLVFIILITGVSLVSASKNSLPGDFLYSIKRVSERTKMAMTVDKSKRAVFRAEILDNRLGEAKILEEKNSPLLKTAVQDFQNELSNFKNDVNILASKSDLPIEDKKEIVPYIGNAEEVKKVLAETKELLSQKNLEVALENITYLENISTTSTPEQIRPELTTEGPVEGSTTSTEENTTSTQPNIKPLLKKSIELKTPAVNNLKGEMILEPEKTGVGIGEIQRTMNNE